MKAFLSYHGQADLNLVYGQAPGLVHTRERPGVEVVVSRHDPRAPVSVLIDPRLGLTECDGLILRRAVLALLDGTVLTGPVQAINAVGDYFEIVAAGSQGDTGERYA